ncbi:axial regulator YABBY 4-like isoform X1 [Nicotiana tabacum]|uniref:Axial regulator YABBY 4-like isoform X1 n=1 Tax=Nicotiana tabacum TaxID=4097 RepID=A0A1S4DF36_TOBAC|nr:axial regulator YABBY 4 isoform X1 [Nicotiana tomentosiformis]XP_016511953.1 PREDICTED: axial regulator YABBY 4-like isoform X1 [Nicotiana tabacum]
MSALNHLFELQDTICYVQCGYCTTILLVSVPCSSLCNKIVTVRCGHCTNLLSVNLMKASLVPLHLFASLNQSEQQKLEVDKEDIDANKKSVDSEISFVASSDEEDQIENVVPVYQVVNKPPEKRQRAPSAYNCFIKEEIKRLKTIYPNMTHKQAFSTAAKNWAHFPPSQHRGDRESCSLGDRKMPKISAARNSQVPRDCNGFLERKASNMTPSNE